jgi:dienelactone hydrolase
MRWLLSRWRAASLWRRIFATTAAVVLIATLTLGIHTLGRFLGWFVERVEPAALSAMLSPHYSVSKPAGDGPFPTALLYHGCDGPKDNMARWAKRLVAEGWAAIVVDSHTPRDYLDLATWRLVCTGQLLPGPERAGDVLVSVADAVEMPFVDPERMALIGMSHGGWSITELLALGPPERLPVNLSAMPEALRQNGLAGVRGVVLVYPWCGLASRARHEGWQNEAPVMFILAREDIIAPSFECELLADTLEEQGHTVEVVMYEDVTHGFDQKERSELSPLVYDPQATADALDRAMDFLATAATAEPAGAN